VLELLAANVQSHVITVHRNSLVNRDGSETPHGSLRSCLGQNCHRERKNRSEPLLSVRFVQVSDHSSEESTCFTTRDAAMIERQRKRDARMNLGCGRASDDIALQLT
jgi:hypothetical protein